MVGVHWDAYLGHLAQQLLQGVVITTKHNLLQLRVLLNGSQLGGIRPQRLNESCRVHCTAIRLQQEAGLRVVA
jgi:hypothetical protein